MAVVTPERVGFSTLIGALVLLLISLLVWNLSRKHVASSAPSVLIVGPPNAGKTCLFLQWAGRDGFALTLPSQRPNRIVADTQDVRITLVDLPGHEKLVQFTNEALRDHNTKPRAVVFMLDAASGISGVEGAAQRLFSVLEVTEARGIPVLVAANKSDRFSALSTTKIRQLLELQISKLRHTRAKQVGESGSDDADSHTWLGLNTSTFTFADLETPVVIEAGSVKQVRTAKWADWLANVI